MWEQTYLERFPKLHCSIIRCSKNSHFPWIDLVLVLKAKKKKKRNIEF